MFLFISIPYLTDLSQLFNPIPFLSGNLCVLYNVMIWNASFPGWHFPAFYGVYQKIFLVTTHGGDLW